MPDPIPVIQCDGCGTVTPARFSGASDPTYAEEARARELKREGWRLTKRRDTCPRCTALEKAQRDG